MQCDLGKTKQNLPQAYVVHLAGSCAACKEECIGPTTKNDCEYFNRSVTVRQVPADPCRFTYTFGQEPSASGPLHPQQLTLTLTKHGEGTEEERVSVEVALEFEDCSPVVWQSPRVLDIANIGCLQRRATRSECCSPKIIEVSTVPTPDYCPPQPEWTRGNPDDLNDADYWPVADVALGQDSAEVPIRYFNGEVQLRIKDIGSDGYGFPWGHTRIYSNRLSNSYDFGNGYNWVINELPQLVLRRNPPDEIKQLPHIKHSNNKDETPTGCTIVFFRGTRNSLWFDELRDTQTNATRWQVRYGAKHTLEHFSSRFQFELRTPNGNLWTFDDFTPSCDPKIKNLNDWVKHQRAPGRFKKLNGPYPSQIVSATYDALGRVDIVHRGIEFFKYKYFDDNNVNAGRIESITWRRDSKHLPTSDPTRELESGDLGDLTRVVYTYYEGTLNDAPHGNIGDLKTSHTEIWDAKSNQWRARPFAVHY